jgi:hypothetical protein
MKKQTAREKVLEQLATISCYPCPEELRFSRRDSTWEVRRGYFYRPTGFDEHDFSVAVAKAGFKVLDYGDRFAHWPKDSYFWVKFQVVEEGAND